MSEIPVDPPYKDPEWLPESQVDCYREGWKAARKAILAPLSGPVDASGEPEQRLEKIKAILAVEWRLQATQGIHHDHLSDLAFLIAELEFWKARAAAVPSSPAQPCPLCGKPTPHTVKDCVALPPSSPVASAREAGATEMTTQDYLTLDRIEQTLTTVDHITVDDGRWILELILRLVARPPSSPVADSKEQHPHGR